MEITGKSKLLDVLSAYPQLEEQIISSAPPFKNLRNPVLRRTVGQLATIERVAQVGNLDVSQLVNSLRRAAGQQEIQANAPVAIAVPRPAAGDPAWTAGQPQFIVNGSELLQQEIVPLERVNELLPQLGPDGFILLVTDFEPSPIMDAMHKQNRRLYHKQHPNDPGLHLTYIAA
jgi:hypothetical protein